MFSDTEDPMVSEEISFYINSTVVNEKGENPNISSFISSSFSEILPGVCKNQHEVNEVNKANEKNCRAEEEDVQTQPKKKRIKEKVVTEVDRPPVVLIDCENKQAVNIHFQNKEKKKKEETYNAVKHLRQDQRTKHLKTLQREAWKMKVLTDDDVMVVVQSKERKKDMSAERNEKLRKKIKPVRAFTTTPNLWYDVNEETVHEKRNDNVADENNDDDDDDDLFYVTAQNSPSKRPVKTTAREQKRMTEKVCAKCHVKWDSPIDRKIDSPVVGCDGYNSDNTRCMYWAHLCCLGLPDFSRAEFAEREFYCPAHNPKIAEIRALVEREQNRKKRVVKTKQKI